MCGRYTATSPNAIRQRFPDLELAATFAARFNVAPSQSVAIAKNDGRNEITQARWGLIPAWARSPAEQKIQPINAKAESLSESRMFAPLLKRRRCILFADGFFEWEHVGGKKIPYYFRLKSGEPFAFAGLFDVWHDELVSCALITGKPNELVAPIHSRMPVILNPADAMRWITPDEADVGALHEFLRPYPAAQMHMHAVADLVNRPVNDEPLVVAPRVSEN